MCQEEFDTFIVYISVQFCYAFMDSFSGGGSTHSLASISPLLITGPGLYDIQHGLLLHNQVSHVFTYAYAFCSMLNALAQLRIHTSGMLMLNMCSMLYILKFELEP